MTTERTAAATAAWLARYGSTRAELTAYMQRLAARRGYLLRLGKAVDNALAEAGIMTAPRAGRDRTDR